MNLLVAFLVSLVVLLIVVLVVRRVLHGRTRLRVQRRFATPGRHRILTEMFDTLNTWCHAHDIACIPSYGTLLGLVRDDRIIPWDDDVDVFVERAEWQALCRCVPAFNAAFRGRYRLERQQILWHDRMTLHHVGSELTADVLQLKPRTWLPINVFLPDEWTFYARIPKDFVQPIQRGCMDYGQRVLDMPARPEALLAHWFGDDWRTPKPPADPPAARPRPGRVVAPTSVPVT
jgi:hypothetical protein